MAVLKELMTDTEKTKYDILRRKMLEAPTYLTTCYFSWRTKRVLKQAKRRVLESKKVS